MCPLFLANDFLNGFVNFCFFDCWDVGIFIVRLRNQLQNLIMCIVYHTHIQYTMYIVIYDYDIMDGVGQIVSCKQ